MADNSTTRILILNSDSPHNRGDRAILQGNIRLVRSRFPDADIWALSQFAERDENWFGIKFLPMSPYSASPLQMLRLMWTARQFDLVLWGGGEILKDYTNILGNLYWLIKLKGVALFNSNIIGMYQGIGPTSSELSKKLIVAAVNTTRTFYVRDQESKDKLEQWGVSAPVVVSYDPAINLEVRSPDIALLNKLRTEFDIDEPFLNNSIGIGLRSWFHYKKSGWLPARFRFWEGKQEPSDEYENYKQNVADLLNWLQADQDCNFVFYPMHMAGAENDAGFSKEIISLLDDPDCSRVIDSDSLSPDEYVSSISASKLFIGARLHSTILATVANVPSFVFYYVDKGRLYFEQIGMQQYSQPIEALTDSANLPGIKQSITSLIGNSREVKSTLAANLAAMVANLQSSFQPPAAENSKDKAN